MDGSGLIGQTISHYRILEKLGGGGMGVVYKAEDTLLGRLVALKFLSEPLVGDTAALQRFQREARMASALDHPNICTIYEIGEHVGLPFIAMQYLEGQTLEQRIADKPLPIDQVVEMGIQIADALEAAHAMGIIHRDIKPSNIYITKRDQPKILDFGVAKLTRDLRAGASEASVKAPTTVDALSTVPGARIGTFAYMSPEQERGEDLDARSDLFSFGLLLYDMATGWHSFSDKVAAVIHDAVGSQEPVVRSATTLPAGLGDIISKATQVDRDRRYQSAAEMSADLKRLRRETESGQAAIASVTSVAQMKRGIPGWKLTLSAGSAAMIIAAGVFFYSHRATALTEKDTILLADFENKTGDPVFDDTLRQGLSVQLEQSPFLSVIPDQLIRDTLQMMDQKPDVKLTPEIAWQLCQRTGSAAVLDGSIAQIGAQYLLTLKAVNCVSGRSLASTHAQASDKDHVLDALGKTASEIRNKLGESLKTVQKFDIPLEQATTPSLEALKAYSAAWKVALSVGYSDAIPLFKRAIEIDPNFAMAYASLGRMYSDIGESALSAENSSKAYQLRDRASDRERFFIDVNYYRQVTRNLEDARESLKLWSQTYPRDVYAHSMLSGFTSQGTGNYEQAIQEAIKAIDLDPDFTPAYINMATSYFYLDRLEEASGTLRRAAERKLEIPDGLALSYYIAFLNDDHARMQDAIALAKSKTSVVDLIVHSESLVLARSGRLQAARSMSRQAIDLATRARKMERAATFLTGQAVWEALFGNTLLARQRAKAALALSNGRDGEYAAGFAMALSRDYSDAQALANDLEKRFPEDTSVKFNYLPTLRALLALQHNEAQRAVELLQVSAPYDLAVPGIDFFAFFGGLYPVYVRGVAYLACHRDTEAAGEFQKILDHRGIVAADPVGTLARLQMARAYARLGDKAKAGSAYEDLFAIWQSADRDFPILEQAKAEYAKLQ